MIINLLFAVCLQPIEVGICRAEVKSYGFDSTQQKCVQFVYGGCNGNENRFTKLEDCQVACEGKCIILKNIFLLFIY